MTQKSAKALRLRKEARGMSFLVGFIPTACGFLIAILLNVFSHQGSKCSVEDIEKYRPQLQMAYQKISQGEYPFESVRPPHIHFAGKGADDADLLEEVILVAQGARALATNKRQMDTATETMKWVRDSQKANSLMCLLIAGLSLLGLGVLIGGSMGVSEKIYKASKLERSRDF